MGYHPEIDAINQWLEYIAQKLNVDWEKKLYTEVYLSRLESTKSTVSASLDAMEAVNSFRVFFQSPKD